MKTETDGFVFSDIRQEVKLVIEPAAADIICLTVWTGKHIIA